MLPSVGVDLAFEAVSQATSFIRQDTELVAAGAIAALLAIVVLLRVVRWATRSPGERLRRFLAGSDAVTVLVHPNPDPDAMAAAVGVAQIAEWAGTGVTIQYPGQIRHPENRAFRTVLGVRLEPVASAADLAHESVILVDHNRPRGFDGAERIRPDVVIDHHPGDGEGTAITDVRPAYGACSSIVVAYLRTLGATPVEPDGADAGAERSLPWEVATGLMYGILADTNHLMRGCSRHEFAACEYLYPGVDEEAIERIANPQVDAEMLDVTARAITDRSVRGSFAVSDVGEVANIDAIPRAAEELLLLEGITAVVVYGHAEDTIHLSGRSLDDRVHVGETLESIAEDVPESAAGGHARMGGGQLSRTHLAAVHADGGLTTGGLDERLFDALNGSR